MTTTTTTVASDINLGFVNVAGTPVHTHGIGRHRAVERYLSLRRWVAGLALVDAVVALMCTCGAVLIRFHDRLNAEQGVLAVALASSWLVSMLLCGAYNRRILSVGPEEFRRVGRAGLWLFALVACGSYLTHADLSREAVLLTVVLLTLVTMGFRVAARKRLHRAIEAGHRLHRVVVAGSRQEVSDLVRHVRRSTHAGFDLVGACVPGRPTPVEAIGGSVPVVGGIQDIAAAVRLMDADTIAVAGVTAVPSEALRRLSWELEGSGVDLVVAPAITDIAGPRIVVRPMNGLPVLHVGEPAFSGAQRMLKHGIEVMISALLLLLLLPFLLVVAVIIKLTSPGPVLFKQGRIGHGGRFFVMYKFRTMRSGAQDERDQLSALNEHDGPLFKLRSDPRVTPFGRWLRRYSVDELPQLWNVLRGSMSLVGPRPPLPEEVEAFPVDAQRRLLVKPGITGLWQVSGRSDLSWEETLRLDLYYIDNWSVPYDLALLWKTVTAVLAGRGAY